MSKVYSLTQQQTKEAIKLHLQANVPTLITSVGGAGKSSLVYQVAEELDLHVVDLRLSQLTRFDLIGFPTANDEKTKMSFLPVDEFILEGDSIPNGKSGVLLFLDELLQADKYVQGASYKLILDRMVGKHKLHPNTRIIAAGNGVLNSQSDNKMIAPLKSRFTHINMEVNLKEFKAYIEEQVMQGNWHSLLLGFISFKPEHIINYDPKTINDVTTYSSPRTLNMLSDLVNAGLLNQPPELYEPMTTGIIGELAGNDFNAYVGIYKQLPTIQEIIADPDNCPMPESIGAQWALSTLLLQGITPTLTNQFARYIERISNDDVKVVIYRTLLRKCPSITQEPLVQKSMGILKSKLKQIP